MSVRDVVTDLRTTVEGIDHPEAVAWFEGSLYCGTEAGQLLRIDPASHTAQVVAETGGFLLGLAFDAAGRCYACDASSGSVIRISTGGDVTVVCDVVEGRRLASPNFPVFGADGTLWVTESGSSWDSDDGYLFQIPAEGPPRIVDPACRLFPNGLALSADGTTLYVVQSRLPGIVTYTVNGSEARQGSVLGELPGIVPDGLALDRDGTLYVGCWRPDRVYRIRAGGSPEIYLDDWTAEYLSSPTNLCFGGKDRSVLYFAGLGGWTIREIDVEVPGQPLFYPSLG